MAMAGKEGCTKKRVSRQSTHCDLIGDPTNLPDRVLPTHRDVLRALRQKRFSKLAETNGKEPGINDLAQETAEDVIGIWDKASVPTITTLRTKERIKKLHAEYSKLKDYPKSQAGNTLHMKRVSNFQQKCLKLFDISSCKCNLADPKAVTHCSCQKKIPSREHSFLLDQRGVRKMVIASIDMVVTRTLKRKHEREDRQLKKKVSETEVIPNTSDFVVGEGDDDEAQGHTDADDETDSSYVASMTFGKRSSQMRVPLPETSKVADRFGVSHTAAAALASSVLEDVGLVTSEDKSMVIDRSKIQRERVKTRQQSSTSDKSPVLEFLGLYFDGRKDRTLVNEKIGSKYHRRLIVQEHISLVQEPGGKYIGHITPESGTSNSIATGILSFLNHIKDEGQGRILDNVRVIGSDGTNSNTGHLGGVITLIENRLQRNLQWAICLLHFNELPLRHLFTLLDGPTTGPGSFSGPIGQKLADCEKKPVVRFRKIYTELPDIHTSDLSTDQKYLLEMCRAISAGSVHEDLASRDPGPLNHSRWLTAGNRTLRLYIATSRPSRNLVTITNYIMKVYARLWFCIKRDWQIRHASIHTWNAIQYSRYLPYPARRTVDEVIQNNAYFLHPENLLVSMLFDERSDIKRLAVKRIMNARAQEDAQSVRQFQIPTLNFRAKDYTQVIDWETTKVTPPPLLRDMSEEELMLSVTDPLAFASRCIWQFPCHTQAVERTVKLVTTAATSVCGFRARDGMIRNTLKSREEMPKFAKKTDYKDATK